MRARFAIIGCTVALAAGTLSGCTPPESYVALGDSYTAGPGVLPQDPTVPGCLRSDANYPNLIDPLNGLAFRDVSCSGAQTKDMTQAQDVDPDPDNPPQFDALDAHTKIVTLGIGGNDIGFTNIAKTCGSVGPSDPNGSPCRTFYNKNGYDEIAVKISAMAPKLRDVLLEIVGRSPAAKIFTVGYPAILPETDAEFTLLCQATLPIARGDVAYLRDEVEKRLNATILFVTASLGHAYVDTYTPSIGFDACKDPTVRWVDPVIGGFPVHPNSTGMNGMAKAVKATMVANGITVS